MQHLPLKTALFSALFATAPLSQAQSVTLPEISFGGLLETSIQHEDANGVEKGENTQFVLDTVEIALGAHINDQIFGEVVLLQEDIGTDDKTDFEVDTALIGLATGYGTLTAGKMIVPFTTGETQMISDSLTLVEPNGNGIGFDTQLGPLEVSAYVVDPDNGYINDDYYGNTNLDQSELGWGDLSGVNAYWPVNDYLAFNGSYAKIDDDNAYSGAAFLSVNQFGLIAEGTDLDVEDHTRYNIEAFYESNVGTFSVAGQRDGENQDYILVGYNKEIYTNTHFLLEYNQNTDTDDKLYQAMLAVEF
ncbi:hypothetical protein [Thiomicrospira sp. WB1]|uniref:hypothetical protein n=1 Tax=Thiomicrospira sp. WB1 TaxID=1685380 RepID=UPI00074B0C80|nr:hypothetical protein [Thiomicrospira sp. WB1]KUJ72565.1 hypothetical protein AVO41_01795 [Thiomicrospira sp. WB1]